MTKTNLIMESYFSGDAIEWLNQIPESLIDEAIQILEIDPNEYMKPTGYCPVDNDQFQCTVKTCLWKDLVHAIRRWGIPSPTEMQTSPSKLKSHATDLKKNLSKAVDTLEALEYEAIFRTGTMSKEFTVAFAMRQYSELLRRETEGIRTGFISPLDIKHAFEADGDWQKHYPLDDEIEAAKAALQKITLYIDRLLEDRVYKPSATGTSKKGKDNYDTLIWALCYIYKKYTGKVPISWNTGTSAINAGKYTGSIIPFLQTILPHTAYTGKITPGALQKKIIRIKDAGKYKDVWSDSKN